MWKKRIPDGSIEKGLITTILQKRYRKHNPKDREYLVKWKQYNYKDNSWLQEQDLL